MTRPLDPATLAARTAIAETIHLCAHAIDRRRWPLMAQVFHDDATVDYGTIKGSWRAFVAHARAIIDPIGATQHVVANMLIAIDGDGAVAESYLVAYHVVPPGLPATHSLAGPGEGTRMVVVGARYVDRLACRDGDWRILHRDGLHDWREDRPYDPAPAAHWAARAGDEDRSRAVVAHRLTNAAS